jgi:hypothetical protein
MVELEDEEEEIDGETILDPALQHIAEAVRDRASKQKADDGKQRYCESLPTCTLNR